MLGKVVGEERFASPESGRPGPSGRAARSGRLALERWSHEVGLAGGFVRDIVEDRTGFLWLATSGGLSRFDGRSFRNFTAATEPNLPGSQINAIALGPDVLVWIGLEHGGVQIVDERGVRLSPRVEALPPVVVRSLLADAAGTLWIGTDRGLWRSGSGGLAAVRLSDDARPADVRKLVAARDGSIWVRTYAHGLRRVEAGTVSDIPDAPGCRGLALAFGPDGWAVTSCVDGIWERGAGESTWTLVSSAGRSESLLVDRSGALWYGEARGLVRRSPGGRPERLTAAEGLGDWRIRALFEDSRGEIWVGSYSAGVSRLWRGAVLAIGPREGLPLDVRARAGQQMTVVLKASNKMNYFNVLPPGSETALFVGSDAGSRFDGKLPADGDYAIRVYLMRAAARRNESSKYTLTVSVVDAPAAAAAPAGGSTGEPSGEPFDSRLELLGISFRVKSPNTAKGNTVQVVPVGLEIDNSPVTRDIDGVVTGAEVADINADRSPEVYVYVKSTGSDRRVSLVAYSANKRKSLGQIYLPELSESPGAKATKGYRGHDDMAVVEGSLVRRFPIYGKGKDPEAPSGKTRQIQYKLRQGEAGWVLKVDKVLEY